MQTLLHIWDATPGDEIGNFQNNRDVGTASIGWSPDGSQIAFGGDGLSIRIETIPEN
jgi:hypothetical protein